MPAKKRTLNWISNQIELAGTVLDNNPAKSKEAITNHSRMMILINVAHELRANPNVAEWLIDEMGRTEQIVRKIGSTTNGAWNARLEALEDAYRIYQNDQ